MSTTASLALVQLMGLDALEARVPAALSRAQELASDLTRGLADELGGEVCRSSVRGMAVRFEQAAHAATFTIRLHQQMLEQPWSPTLLVHPNAAEVTDDEGAVLFRGLRMRAAVHRGPCLPSSQLLMGPAAYHAARLLEAAHTGQTLVSQEAWRFLAGPLPAGAVLRDLGRHVLPGVQGRTRLFQLLPSPLDRRTFPPTASPDHARAHATRLPKIIGREGDLQALHELLRLGVRMISVVGPRGVGRGRLCAQLAARPPEGFARGRVERIKLRGPGTREVVRATADALEIPTAHAPTLEASIEQLGHALESMGPTLLIYDGVETSSLALRRWLQLAPDLRVVIHGPEPLATPLETVYRLQPLPPPGPARARHSAAVRLYSETAAKVIDGFHLDEPVDVAVVVQALGGNPLAIRLAAGMVDRLPPPMLAARCLGRQLSVDDMVAVVVELMDSDQRALLEAAAVIPGPFEPDLPAQLMGTGQDAQTLIHPLRELARRNLVSRVVDGELPQITRFMLDAAIRDAILDGMEPELIAARRATLADLVLERCTFWSKRAFSRNRPEVLARLALDWERLLSIVEWAEEARNSANASTWTDRAVRAVLVLEPILRSRGPLPSEQELLDRAMALSDGVLGNDPALQVRLLVARADSRLRAGSSEWKVDLDRARNIAARWDDALGAARADLIEGRALAQQGETTEALERLDAARRAFAEHDDPLRAALAEGRWGAVAMQRGRLDDAEPVLVDAARQLRALDAVHLLARVLGWLGRLYRRTDRADAARSVTRESIRIHEELGAVAAECRARHELATLDHQLARYGGAADGLHRAIERARSIGDRRVESRSLLLLAVVSLARADHGAARAHLLEALALSRERRDSRDEGEVMGYLGIVHHLDEQPDAARDYYAQARRQCHAQRAHDLEALFTGWLGGLEAEQLDAERARTLAVEARRCLDRSGDRQIGQALQVLGHVVVLTEGVLEGAAERGRQQLRHHLRGTDPRRLSSEGRLAYRRVRRLAARGLLRTVPPPAEPTPTS